METLEIISILAAVCTTASFVPQAVKVIITRDTKGISFFMYLLFVTGVAFWSAWGFGIGSLSVILANSIAFCLSSVVLTFKIINMCNGKDKLKK